MPDQAPRDQLAEILAKHAPYRNRRGGVECTCPAPHWISEAGAANGWAEHVAEAIVGPGWRPPARVITAVAELDALAPFSVVLGYGIAHQAIPDDRAPVLWIKPTGRPQTSAELLADCPRGGVTVLHDTTEPYTPENGDTP
jgi:hypothetical protein